MNKQSIFDNIEEFTPEELVKFIRQGIVTQAELEDPHNTNGFYTAPVRRKVNDLIINAEPNDWNAAKTTNTFDSYQEYLNAYPNGAHNDEAKKAINEIQHQKDDIDWNKAVSIDTEEAYQNYLTTYKTGKHRDEARKAKNKKAEEGKFKAEEEVWNKVNKKDKSELLEFIKNYPQSPYSKKAKQCISDIDGKIVFDIEALLEEINNVSTNSTVLDKESKIFELIQDAIDDKDINIDIDDILDLIEDDKNIFSSKVVRRLINEGYLTSDDLADVQISREFLRQMARNTTRRTFERSTRPMNINRESTEIYFWGIPSSGKTCALGAILSVAQNGDIARSMTLDTECQGYEYLNLLPQCFDLTKTVTILPEGTPPDCSYEMGFDLEDQDRKTHPITCIDFAGEMIRTIYRKHAGKSLSDTEQRALTDFTNLLGGKDENGKPIGNRTNNRKIHFFVVEYGAEQREYDGLPQKNLLASAVSYIDEIGVFKDNTDAIYLIVTKVDKIKASSDEDRNKKLAKYVRTNYSTYFGNLEKVCAKYRINGGDVPVIPFSLGTVCLQDMCKIDAKYANEVVKIILKRSHSYSTGKKGWFEKTFRG